MARAMLDESRTSDTFLGEAAHTVVNILNKAHVHVNSDQTPYELWYGKPSTVKHFRIFGSKCFIKNNDEKIGKFEPRADEGIFLGYSSRSKAYKCYNKILWKTVECIDVVIDEAGKNPKQLGVKKKGKSNKKKQENSPPKKSFEKSTGQKKPRYPFYICDDEHFMKDFPHKVRVMKFLKNSNTPAVLTNPFPSLETNLVAIDHASPSQVLMISISK